MGPRSSTLLGTNAATMVRCASSYTIRPYRTRPSKRRPPPCKLPTSVQGPVVREEPVAPLMNFPRFEFERMDVQLKLFAGRPKSGLCHERALVPQGWRRTIASKTDAF